jgi:hypothetical protein
MRRRIRLGMRDGSEHLFMLTAGGIASYSEQLKTLVDQTADAARSSEPASS